MQVACFQINLPPKLLAAPCRFRRDIPEFQQLPAFPPLA